MLLRQELECVRESMLEQQMLVVQKEKEVTALHQLLGRVQGACQEKIMVCEVELVRVVNVMPGLPSPHTIFPTCHTYTHAPSRQ